VRFAVRADIVEIGKPFGETGLLPQLLVTRQSFLAVHLEDRSWIEFMAEAERAFVNTIVNLVVARLPLALRLGRHGAIAQRCTIVGCPLEDGQMRYLFGDLRDELNRGRSGPDYRNALALEIDGILGPGARMQREPLEAIDAREIGREARRQNSDGGDQKMT